MDQGYAYVVVMMIVVFVGLFFLFKINQPDLSPLKMKEGYWLLMSCRRRHLIKKPGTVKELIYRIGTLPEVKVVGGISGLNIISGSNRSNAGTIFVNLKSWDDRKGEGHHAQDVMNKLRGLTSDIKEARILVIAPPAIPGLGATAGLHLSCSKPAALMM